MYIYKGLQTLQGFARQGSRGCAVPLERGDSPLLQPGGRAPVGPHRRRSQRHPQQPDALRESGGRGSPRETYGAW